MPERGGGGNSGNARKKTFIFMGGLPLAFQCVAVAPPSVMVFVEPERQTRRPGPLILPAT